MKQCIWLLMVCLFACSPEPELTTEQDQQPARSFANKVGTVFTPSPQNALKPPSVEIITLPEIADNDAIWGATGRDDNGSIYFATSSHGGEYGSSYLYQYDPITKQISAQSDTVTQLKVNNVYRQGMRQNKLHSKIYQADDGYLYFSSFDEGGEAQGINPTWGGNLWRKKPNDQNWQHVFATEEALVGINTNGRYVYALGYWDHVLYQYDTQTSKIKRVVVGSVGTHTTRNFLVDEVGHVYVPRLTENDFNEVTATLVEFDVNLAEVATYPLPSYQSEKISSHHGIVAYTSMKNGDIYFTSAEGGLYRIQPFLSGNSKVSHQGLMHPDGEAYIGSLFSIDGEGLLAGIGRSKANKAATKYEWIIYQTSLKLPYTTELPLVGINSPLIYGSLTRDNEGRFYSVGWHKVDVGYSPLILKITLK